MRNRHGSLATALEYSVRDSAGSTPADLRAALISREPAPEVLAGYVQQVRQRAFAMTNDDVAGMLGAGYTEDQAYEITVATALGEGLHRLRVGLAALDESGRRAPFETADEADAESDADLAATPVSDPQDGPFEPTVVPDSNIPLARRGGAE